MTHTLHSPLRGLRRLASRSPGGRFHRFGALALAGSLGLGCTIAPVVSAPEATTGRYADCERAARDYCENAIGATGSDRDRCLAEHTFECVSVGGR